MVCHQRSVCKYRPFYFTKGGKIMSSVDEMRILQKEADLAKKKLQEVENAGEVASNSGIKGNAENKNIYP